MFRLDSVITLIPVPARLKKLLKFHKIIESALQIAAALHGKKIRVTVTDPGLINNRINAS